MPTVNMPEDMQLRPDPLHGDGQLLTAETLIGGSNRVQDPERRSVGNEDVRFLGDHVPVPADRWATVNIERPVEEAGLLW